MLFRAGNAQCHQTFARHTNLWQRVHIESKVPLGAMLAMSVETGIGDSPGVSVAKQTRINHPTNNQ